MIRSDSYFCGPTAALLWGIPLPGRFESDPRLHIGLPHGERATRLTGTIGHHFVITPDELTQRGSLKVTSPERTWCDLAPYLSLEDLVAAGDRVIWRKDPLAAHERMIELAQRHPGRRGRTTRFAAGQLLSDRSDSRPESRFRVRFRLAGLPTASVNFELYNHAGQLTAILDLAWPDYRVGFDYEGDHHRSDVSQWRRDLTRFPAIEDLGWYAFRAGTVQLDDSTDVIARVSAKLRERGWSSETSD